VEEIMPVDLGFAAGLQPSKESQKTSVDLNQILAILRRKKPEVFTLIGAPVAIPMNLFELGRGEDL
jgi:hypothetical protein